MSQRLAPIVLATFLSLIATVGGSAWARGNHGDRGPQDHRQAPQVDRYPARNDAPPIRGDRQTINDDRPPRSNNYPVRDNGQPARYEPRNVDLQYSVRQVQRETGGQVLRAQPILRDGREMYRVKVLTPEGRVRVYEDDASLRHPAHRDVPYRDAPPPRRRFPG